MKYLINTKFLEEVQDRSKKALWVAWEFLAWKLKEAVPKVTHELANSIHTEYESDNVVRVGSSLWSAYVQENWRMPWRYPNMDAITWWVIRRFWYSWNVTQWYDSAPTETKQAAFLVARKIATRWIEAKHLFSNVRERNKNQTYQVYLNALKR